MRFYLFLLFFFSFSQVFAEAGSAGDLDRAKADPVIVSSQSLGPVMLHELLSASAVVAEAPCSSISLCRNGVEPEIWTAICYVKGYQIYATAIRFPGDVWHVTQALVNDAPCLTEPTVLRQSNKGGEK